MGTKIGCDYYWNGHHLLGSRKSSRSYRFSLNSEPNVKKSVVGSCIIGLSSLVYNGVLNFNPNSINVLNVIT